MKKDHIIIIVAMAAVSLLVGPCSFSCGKILNATPDFRKTRNEAEEYLLDREKRFHKALLDGLKWYMKNDSASWNKAFVKTEEYEKIKNLIGYECEEFNANEKEK